MMTEKRNLGADIELINTCQTPEQAFEKFCSIVERYGYDRITYSLATNHPTLGLPQQHGLATSYPDDWMKYYREKHYERIDPVTLKVLSGSSPFFWSDVIANPDIALNSLKLMNEAEDAGVTDGIGITLYGAPGEVVGVGLARSAAIPKKEQDYRVLADVYLLSTYFHETYRAMLLKSKQIKLTDKEIGVLSWAAEGKTDHEIAILLNISKDTVRYHWKKIFLKLGTNGRLYAILKAVRLQLITPLRITSPYQSW